MQDKRQELLTEKKIHLKDSAAWQCFVCTHERTEAGAGVEAEADGTTCTALSCRADWSAESVLRTRQISPSDDDSTVSDSERPPVSSGARAKRKGKAPRVRASHTPLPRKVVLDMKAAYRFPAALFEISLGNPKAQQPNFSKHINLDAVRVDAAKVSAARRDRTFFPSVLQRKPLREAVAQPLTVEAFLLQMEGTEAYQQRCWPSDDPRLSGKFSTICTKTHADRLRMLNEFLNMQDLPPGQLPSYACLDELICTQARLCQPCRTRKGKEEARKCGNRETKWTKWLREANFIFDRGTLTSLPKEYNAVLMGFEKHYTGGNGTDKAQKMIGNAVHTDVIDYLLRPIIEENLPRDRRLVFLSLFNGIDGFLVGFEKAMEAMYIIRCILKHQQDELEEKKVQQEQQQKERKQQQLSLQASSSDDSSSSDSSDDDSRRRRFQRPVRFQSKAETANLLTRDDLICICLHDLRKRAQQVLPAGMCPWLSSSTGSDDANAMAELDFDGKSPPWLAHGLVFVPVECDARCREVTKTAWRRRQTRYWKDASDWLLIDEPAAFCATEDKCGRTNGKGKEKTLLSAGDPDVAVVAALSVAELEHVIQQEIVRLSGKEPEEGSVVIDLLTGGSPCVDLVGNAFYKQGGMKSLRTLKWQDESHLFFAQAEIYHKLRDEYKRREQGGAAGATVDTARAGASNQLRHPQPVVDRVSGDGEAATTATTAGRTEHRGAAASGSVDDDRKALISSSHSTLSDANTAMAVDRISTSSSMPMADDSGGESADEDNRLHDSVAAPAHSTIDGSSGGGDGCSDANNAKRSTAKQPVEVERLEAEANAQGLQQECDGQDPDHAISLSDSDDS